MSAIIRLKFWMIRFKNHNKKANNVNKVYKLLNNPQISHSQKLKNYNKKPMIVKNKLLINKVI